MKKTGVAQLPLHTGRAPAWLFQRMSRLAREIIILMVSESGPEKLLDKFSDPFWFQAFGCVLGFDWHSSGLTTTVCGAVKDGIFGIEKELGFYAAGGKGATARKTPRDIMDKAAVAWLSRPQILVHASRLTAKVDNNAVQDGYSLYHHSFYFTRSGRWAVVQQGMNPRNQYARRYHWASDGLDSFVNNPHRAICANHSETVLNLVSSENEKIRAGSVEIVRNLTPEKISAEYQKVLELNLTARHPISFEQINPRNLSRILLKTYDHPPADFEELLETGGVGAKTLRALALISELVFGSPISYRDPARFAFAHGGKDGYPYPVDRKNYDISIDFLKKMLNKARIDRSEKIKAFARLQRFY